MTAVGCIDNMAHQSHRVADPHVDGFDCYLFCRRDSEAAEKEDENSEEDQTQHQESIDPVEPPRRRVPYIGKKRGGRGASL